MDIQSRRGSHDWECADFQGRRGYQNVRMFKAAGVTQKTRNGQKMFSHEVCYNLPSCMPTTKTLAANASARNIPVTASGVPPNLTSYPKKRGWQRDLRKGGGTHACRLPSPVSSLPCNSAAAEMPARRWRRGVLKDHPKTKSNGF